MKSIILGGLAILASLTFHSNPRLQAQTIDPQQLGQSGDGPVANVAFSPMAGLWKRLRNAVFPVWSVCKKEKPSASS